MERTVTEKVNKYLCKQKCKQTAKPSRFPYLIQAVPGWEGSFRICAPSKASEDSFKNTPKISKNIYNIYIIT